MILHHVLRLHHYYNQSTLESGHFGIFFDLSLFFSLIFFFKHKISLKNDYLKDVGKQDRPGSVYYLGQTLSRLEAMKRNLRN